MGMFSVRKEKRLVRTSDLTGMKFGRLTVQEFAGYGTDKDGKAMAMWHCLCDCGNDYLGYAKNLKNSNTQSCGCFLRESVKTNKLKHGHSACGQESPEYMKWLAMRARCYYPRHANFRNYGGRGIIVCERWMNSFENFLLDMGKCPEGLTLERIDTNGNYEPSNCKWATTAEQAVNRRNNHCIEFQGKRQTISQWGMEVGVKAKVLLNRLKRGWSVEQALTTPVMQ